MFPGSPASSQIIGNSLTANGTLATVPAGMTLTANVQLSAAVALLGTMTATVTVSGAGAAPANGTVLSRIIVSGLLAAAAAASDTNEIIVKAPPGNSVDVVFTAAGAGGASAVINGWYFS